MAETGYDEYQVDLVICMDVTASMKPITGSESMGRIKGLYRSPLVDGVKCVHVN